MLLNNYKQPLINTTGVLKLCHFCPRYHDIKLQIHDEVICLLCLDCGRNRIVKLKAHNRNDGEFRLKKIKSEIDALKCNEKCATELLRFNHWQRQY